MEGRIRLHIRLTIEDSGSHQRAPMGNNIHNLIEIMGFPIRYISSTGVYLMVEFGFLKRQAPVINYISG
ncbi:hypothetical protein MA16_Dca027793 [Dendrobium catenatum]|uniref:Uncharacterized protein n=1 Tax=Dendrobium catenatum TaxID=906689 RepID=A0A2I0W7V4_9ASPA|nr:hypothetical protein MA16_Dca027793 [Dendrobium catenatum]